MEAIILAGGLGSRLRSVCSDRPKPMAPVAGRPFLEHLLDHWIEQGVSNFILSVGYLHSIITNHFGTEYKNIPITYSIEETPLGTGGAFLAALPLLKHSSPFLLLNGDTFFSVFLPPLLRFHKETQSHCTLSLYSRPDNPRYDSLQLSSTGRIEGFNQDQRAKKHLINGGCYLFERTALTFFKAETLPLSLEKEILPFIIDQQKCYGMQFNELFIDIGLPDDLRRSQSLLLTANNEKQ